MRKRSTIFALVLISSIVSAQKQIATMPFSPTAKITFVQALGDSILIRIQDDPVDPSGLRQEVTQTWIVTKDGSKEGIRLPVADQEHIFGARSTIDGIEYYTSKQAKKELFIQAYSYSFSKKRNELLPNKNIVVDGEYFKASFDKDLYFLYANKKEGFLRCVQVHDFKVVSERKYKVPPKVFRYDSKSTTVYRNGAILTPAQAAKPMKIQISGEKIFICIDDRSYINQDSHYVPGKSFVMIASESEFNVISFNEELYEGKQNCNFGTFVRSDTVFRVNSCKSETRVLIYKWDSLLVSIPIKQFAEDSTFVRNELKNRVSVGKVAAGFSKDASSFVLVQSADSTGYTLKVGSHLSEEGGGLMLLPFGLLSLAVDIFIAVVFPGTEIEGIDSYFYLQGNLEKGFHGRPFQVPQDVIDKFELYVPRASEQYVEKTYVLSPNFKYGIYTKEREVKIVRFPLK
jgi:hypothetical protein